MIQTLEFRIVAHVYTFLKKRPCGFLIFIFQYFHKIALPMVDITHVTNQKHYFLCVHIFISLYV